MNLRRLMTVAGCTAICGAVLFHPGSAATAQQDSLAVRYARAQLKYAELTLQKAQRMGQKVPGTFATGTMDQFNEEVEVAKSQLQSAMKAEGSDPLQTSLQRAEVALRLAETRLKTGTEVSRRAPSVVPETDLERMRVAVEIAQLRLERGRSLVNAPPEAKLQWQFEVLSEELSQIKQQISLLGQNRLSQF